jgi:hypothetical protein
MSQPTLLKGHYSTSRDQGLPDNLTKKKKNVAPPPSAVIFQRFLVDLHGFQRLSEHHWI